MLYSIKPLEWTHSIVAGAFIVWRASTCLGDLVIQEWRGNFTSVEDPDPGHYGEDASGHRQEWPTLEAAKQYLTTKYMNSLLEDLIPETHESNVAVVREDTSNPGQG